MLKAIANADSTKFDTAAITINAKFAISPTEATVVVSQTQQFTANYDVDHWEVNGVGGGSATVGTVSSSGLYTAPANVPTPATVTVQAYKLGDTSKTAAALVTIAASSTALTISPATATVAAGRTRQFTANMDVDWAVSSANMGTTDPAIIGGITTGGLFTAPVYPPWTAEVTITATSKSDANVTATATVTVTFSNASLEGGYAFYYRGFDGGDPYFMVGRLDADGSGAIVNGVVDVHFPGNVYQASIPFAGTYTVSADGRGTMSLNADLGAGPITMPMRFVISNSSSVNIVGFDDTGSAWGGMRKEDPVTVTAGLSGTYVYKMDGFTEQLSTVAAAGMLTAASTGGITEGLEDINLGGTASSLAFTGTWAINAGSHRGAITLTLTDGPSIFYFYPVDSSTAFFITQGWGGAALGVLTKQTGSSFSNASLNGGVVFSAQGYTPGMPISTTTAAFAVGRFVADGAGTITGGVADNNVNGVLGTAMPVSGTYSMAANGRATLSLTAGPSTNQLIAYMIGDDSAFYMVPDGMAVATGQFLPAPGPFSTIRKGWGVTMRSTYIGVLADATGAFVAADSGGPWTGTEDFNDAGALVPDQALSATYTISTTTGRGEAVISAGSASAHVVFYQVSSAGTMVMVGADNFPTYGFATRQY